MNIKVVIIWGFAIIILAGLGAFGYFNQDLLLLEEEEYIPAPSPSSISKTCRSTTDNGESIYNFTIKDDLVNVIWISYTTKVSDLEGYEAANSISNEITSKTLNGITSAGLQGGSADYSLKNR